MYVGFTNIIQHLSLCDFLACALGARASTSCALIDSSYLSETQFLPRQHKSTQSIKICSLWKINPRLFNETGLTRYPSTPLPNASRLSSAVANPVKAKIFARAWTIFGGGILTGVPGAGTTGTSAEFLRAASIRRMARVASCPFITGIEMSIRIRLPISERSIHGSWRLTPSSLEGYFQTSRLLLDH